MTFVLCMAQTIFRSFQEFTIGVLQKRSILGLKLHIHRLGIACGLLGISGSIIVDECFLDFAHAVALRAGRNGCFRKQLCLTRSFQSDEASSCLSDSSTCSERRPWLCVMTFLFLGPRYSTIRSPSSWVKTTPPKAG